MGRTDGMRPTLRYQTSICRAGVAEEAYLGVAHPQYLFDLEPDIVAGFFEAPTCADARV